LSLTAAEGEVRRAAVERLGRHIELAAQLDAAVARQKGVRLALEPINRYETDLIHTVDEGLALLAEVGAAADTLGLLLDTFHMNIEEPSITDSICRAAEANFHFHVADSNRWYPGAGHLDFAHILAVLRDEVGYEGWVSAEILPQPDAQTAARRAMERLRDWRVEIRDWR
jgi:sugar phosphate isomerase/epimerase